LAAKRRKLTTGGTCPNVGIEVKRRESMSRDLASKSSMSDPRATIFGERYRVLAVESQSLTIRGVRSGEVLTIINPNPDAPLSPAEYPLGKLIALSDPSTNSPVN
jgi:hypothetical protein